MKKIGLILAGLLLLAGCSSAVFDQKAQLQDATATISTQVAKESKLLSTLDDNAAAFPSTFQAAYAANSEADFQTDGKVAALIQARQKAYKALQASQATIERATTTLTKANSQGTNLPQRQMSDALASLKLARLDHKTFTTYYNELGAAETAFFKTVAADPTDATAVNEALGRLNQYTSSLSQQAEIFAANLQTVTAETKALKKAVAALD